MSVRLSERIPALSAGKEIAGAMSSEHSTDIFMSGRFDITCQDPVLSNASCVGSVVWRCIIIVLTARVTECQELGLIMELEYEY